MLFARVTSVSFLCLHDAKMLSSYAYRLDFAPWCLVMKFQILERAIVLSILLGWFMDIMPQRKLLATIKFVLFTAVTIWGHLPWKNKSDNWQFERAFTLSWRLGWGYTWGRSHTCYSTSTISQTLIFKVRLGRSVWKMSTSNIWPGFPSRLLRVNGSFLFHVTFLAWQQNFPSLNQVV